MNSPGRQITVARLRQQVAKYKKLYPEYVTYAVSMKRVLETACVNTYPTAVIQSRAKSISSFVEKCVRKLDECDEAVSRFTDLCGVRIIVQTLEQVNAVGSYLRENFIVIKADDKVLDLGEDRFGYRDTHFIVRLIPEKALEIGFSPNEVRAIGDKPAEIQLRTWVQHAWAEVMHDRIYKARLTYPVEFKRTSALLAAIMEDGDRTFNRLAGDIDGMLANFNAYASKEASDRELKILELVLSSAERDRKPDIALQIARMAAARGDENRVISILSEYSSLPGLLGSFIRLELGNALCRRHRSQHLSPGYLQGQEYLKEVVDDLQKTNCQTVSDSRLRIGTLAKALFRLAWSYTVSAETTHLARKCYRQALELEPSNPYYFVETVGYEISCLRRTEFIGAMLFPARQAIATCREHMLNGTEMPYAAFTAGRIHLLLKQEDLSLAAYCRGVRYVLDNPTVVPEDVLAAEENWLTLVTNPDQLFGGYRWVADLLSLAGRLFNRVVKAGDADKKFNSPVLIIAGGAGSLLPALAGRLRHILKEALPGFSGTIIAGGTRVGVPGCVGAAAQAIAPRGRRPFRLIGYLPRVFLAGTAADKRYDELIECGEDGFTSEQILRNWEDIISSGIEPEDVCLLGFGGGPLSAIEYRIALGLGSTVALVMDSGGAADELLRDELWYGIHDILPIPADQASVCALVNSGRNLPRKKDDKPDETLERMARSLHSEYVRNNTRRLPENLKPWAELSDTFKTANLEQAGYAIKVLAACGFSVRPSAGHGKKRKPPVFTGFSRDEVERMAELEHGRWNIERLRDGWRYGVPREDISKIHDCIVPWKDLPESVREYDRQAVRMFPTILSQAGLEVFRIGGGSRNGKKKRKRACRRTA